MALILNNITIESRTSDNFVNATQLCKAGGKKFSHWIALESTKELIQELEKSIAGIPTTQINKVIDIRRGNTMRYKQGSWIHPDLAVQLAQWISPSFAIQVSRWVRELFITGSVSIESKKSDEELNELQQRIQTLECENKELESENKAKDSQIYYLHDVHKKFLSCKKKTGKKEKIYIVSTKNYSE